MPNTAALPLLFVLLAGLASAPAGSAAGQDNPPPAPKLPLGKETTRVTGPLDKQGYIDYEAALNAEASRGISAKDNSNVLLLAAFGPAPEGGNGLSATYFRWLDTSPPPRDGEYYLGIAVIGRQKLALSDAQLGVLFDQQSRAAARPWAAKDYPVVAEWLRANEKPLALVLEATKRPDYFNPLCSNRAEGGPSNLIGGLLPTVQRCREVASALNARAMLSLHEGKPEDAWRDLVACHRLARLIARGSSLIEGLVGVAIGQLAHSATVVYLDHARLTSRQAAECLKDLRALPPWPSFADKIDVLERFAGLDALQNLRRNGGAGEFGEDLFGLGRKLTDEEVKALEAVNWADAMRAINGWYDRLAAAMRLEDRARREKALDAVEADLKALREKAREDGDLGKLLAGKGGPAKDAGKRIGDVLSVLVTPAVRRVQQARDRAAQAERNLHMAFALAAYRADRGRYPADLDDLAPDHLATVPGDLFSGKPLIYKPGEKGYQFYSIGPNGKDDGGRWYDDDPPGDDPGVRMPLPPLKKN